jgi:hypothetical protein
MGDGMPYHLEKGPLLCVFEKYLNGDRATMAATLEVVRKSEREDTLEWIVSSPLWTDSAFGIGLAPTGDAMRTRLLEEWFGLEKDTATGNWREPVPAPATTGYWIGYKGDVARIVRRAVLWALELALAVGSETKTAHPEPWPIEIFWKCPAPWFEAWVVSRKVPRTDTGLVSLVLVTPSHRGADVAFSPIARSAVATPNPATHPVPSWQDDYEVLSFAPGAGSPTSEPHPVVTFPRRPRVPARERDYATWVVTHRNHHIPGQSKVPAEPSPEALRRLQQTNTFGPIDLLDFDLPIPQFTEWEGIDDIVIVAPSMAAGGIKHDGQL